ncbi:MAG: hypothetical protein KC613_00655 [Myxococcales bacterium]|nr:hypothetical protein [Myxococcales bacterium]MCB9525265.1 hypothetical protein [Myxococcales bacterium]
MLQMTYYPGAALPPGVLAEVSGLRADVARLPAGVDRAEDRRRLAETLRGCSTVCVLRDNLGEAQGLWATREQVLTVAGRRCLLIYADQVWLRESARGDAAFVVSTLRHGLALCARARCHRVFIGGLANPLSYNALQGWFGTLRCLAEGDIPAAERSLLEAVAKALGERWDGQRARARLLVLPPHIPSHVLTRPGAAERIAHYEALNPDWADGWGLPVVGRVPWVRVAAMPVRSVRRALRRPAARLAAALTR